MKNLKYNEKIQIILFQFVFNSQSQPNIMTETVTATAITMWTVENPPPLKYIKNNGEKGYDILCFGRLYSPKSAEKRSANYTCRRCSKIASISVATEEKIINGGPRGVPNMERSTRASYYFFFEGTRWTSFFLMVRFHRPS